MVTLVAACASEARRALPDRVTLAFGGPPGSVLELGNSATTRLRAFVHGQIRRDRRETVDFTTRARTIDRDPKSGTYRAELATIAKEGHASLRAMAFPERGETIEFETRAGGQILRAGRYPRDSVFYIPSLPMPRGQVSVGDTWGMEHEWLSGDDQMPLRIEVVGILKAIVRCGDGHVCADLEVSGHILLNAATDRPNARFDSRVRGRALFDVARGEVVWTEMRSREEITLGPEVSLVESCLTSRINAARLSCSPDFEADVVVPEL